jgi:Flp pilus assembly protein TadG
MKEPLMNATLTDAQAPSARRRQRGQTLIIMAFLMVFLISLLGLVVDTVRLYILSIQAERAAEAGALAGALYMPNFYDASNPAPDGEYATRRICEAVKQNGITSCPVAAGQIGVTPSLVAGNQYRLQVTVTLQANVFFLAFVSPGFSTATVSRSAVAEYLPAIQLGSRTSYFGDAQDGLQAFVAHINGPWEQKEHGDAYTPKFEDGWTDPVTHPDTCCSPVPRFLPNMVSTNLQKYPSAIANPDSQPTGFTGASGTLGYNYQIVVPATAASGVEVQIATPAFNPYGGGADNEDNLCDDPSLTPSPCASDQGINYMQLTYSLYSTPLLFERSQDVLVASFSPPSLDLLAADLTKHGCGGAQAFDPAAQTCVAQPAYLNGWYTLATLNSLGTYRLVVEATGGYGQHNYGVKLTDTSNNVFANGSGVSIKAWNDMCVAFNLSAGVTSTFDLAEIPAAYAGKTLNFSLFDPGDGGGNIFMRILDPSGNPATWPNWALTVPASNGTQLNASGGRYNGQWLHVPIQIPTSYNPAAGADWWQVEYFASQAGGDVLSINVSLAGSPIHLTP